MDDYENLSHSKWECKYDGVFIPKYRRKTLYGELRQHLGEVFRRLAIQKESWVEEGHLTLAAKDDVAAKLALTVSSKILARQQLNIQRRLSGIRSRSSLLKSRSGWMKPSRNRTRAMIWELRW